MTRTLILIPTASERDVLLPRLEPSVDAADRVELCGFGLVAAAAVTARLLEQLRPTRVLLIGIAGTYVDRLPPGRAAVFDEVACFGIGAGTGDDHQTAGDLGWYHVGGRRAETGRGAAAVGDTITTGGGVEERAGQRLAPCQLLTVAAASATPADADRRRRRFPQAVAEDMEGFAVAMACRLAETPLTIVRGISNHAGQRNLAEWQITQALQAAAELAVSLT